MKVLMITLCLFLGPIYAQNSWVKIGEMPRPVYGGEAVVLDTTIYIIGGYDEQLPNNSVNKYSDSIRVYYPNSGTWGASVKMVLPRYGLIGLNYNDSLLYLGGVKTGNAASSEIYNGKTIPYTYKSNSDFDRNFGTGQVEGNYLYLFGGRNTLVNINYLAKINIRTGNTEFKSNLIFTSFVTNQASASDNKNIYLFGGVRDYLLTKYIYMYNMSSGNLSIVPVQLDKPRIISAAINYGNEKYYLIGGINETSVVGDVEIFDANSMNLSKGPKLNIARKKLMAVKYAGAIYVLGGLDQNDQPVRDIEKLDIPTAIRENSGSFPQEFRLYNNYPNPFNPSTNITYTVAKEEYVSLTIFNALGKEVTTIVSEVKPRGVYNVSFNAGKNGKLLPSGVYFYRLVVGDFAQTKKMILLK